MRYLSRLELVGSLFVFAGLFSACSFVYDLSADQCELNADCDALGGEFEGRECRAGVCVPGNGPTGGTGGMGSGGCKSTSECLDDEKNFGFTACIDGACVPLVDADAHCPLVVPSDPQQLEEVLRQPGEPIIFGSFGPINQGLHGVRTRNYDMAISEFNEETSGLPGPSGRRGLVAVVCETQTDPEESRERLSKSMDHLIQKLKVPGVIPMMYPDDLQFEFERELQRDADKTPLFLSPLDSDSTLLDLPADNGLLWHLLPSGLEIALPYKGLLARALGALGSLPLEEPARIALITTQDNRLCEDMRTIVVDPNKGIVFNGGTTEENGPESFQEFFIRTTDSPTELAPTVDALLEFRPHVIISLTTEDFFEGIYTSLESQWNAEAGTAPRPFYLLSPYHFVSPFLDSRLATNQLRSRIAGVNAAANPNPSLYSKYLSRFKVAYASEMFPSYDGYENFYDAAYYLIYSAAAVASNTAKLTGADLARGMRRVTDMGSSQVYGVGVEQISSALQALQFGSIRLDGTMGPPDFNPKGGRATAGSVWCVDASDGYRSDVLRYDTATGELVLGNGASGNQLDELPCAAEL